MARMRKLALSASSASNVLCLSCRGPRKPRKLSLVSFLRGFFSGFGSESDGETAEDKDTTEGDRVIESGPNTKLPLRASLESAFLDGVPAVGRRCVKSSLVGFFLSVFGGSGAGRGESMSSSSCALFGRPFAMAEFDVCCDMDSGSLVLS